MLFLLTWSESSKHIMTTAGGRIACTSHMSPCTFSCSRCMPTPAPALGQNCELSLRLITNMLGAKGGSMLLVAGMP